LLLIFKLMQGNPAASRIAFDALAQMIVACPACATRYDFPAQRFSANGTMVRCVECGHNWIESRPVEIIDIQPRPLPGPPATAVAEAEIDLPEEREIRRLTEAARIAREEFDVRQRRRRREQLGWAAFALAALSPIAAAFMMPEATVRLMPSSMRLFDALGMPVNIYGLEMRRVEQQHIMVDGTRVISIKGEIVNVSDEDRKVPSLRFILKDGTQGDVYAWTLDAGIRPLRPGEMTTFTTRVASPPPAAEDVQIRFAHADEIGVNPGHEPH
jgi:predicted Zn finger-like uncharacterized protein